MELVEDNHTIELKHGKEVIERFSATGADPTEIIRRADEWLAKQHGR